MAPGTRPKLDFGLAKFFSFFEGTLFGRDFFGACPQVVGRPVISEWPGDDIRRILSREWDSIPSQGARWCPPNGRSSSVARAAAPSIAHAARGCEIYRDVKEQG
jgi:hypothetical protein